jgi:serine/threonine protein phosphatase PrpC
MGTEDGAHELGRLPGAPPGSRAAGVRRHLASYGLSDAGAVRPTNEDHFVVASLQRAVEVRQSNLADPAVFDRLGGPTAYLFAVADGVGGQAKGGEASGLAVATIVEYLSETVGTFHRVDPTQAHAFVDPLHRAVQRAHDTLRATFGSAGRAGHDDRNGPATTLTLALVVWPHAFLVHVGDSRAYLRRAGELRRLTRDQTLAATLVAAQAMSEEQAERAGLHKVLASAVGARDLSPAVRVLALEPGDVLLLCTDGLTKAVPEEEIASELDRPADPESRCRALVARALERGGRDNITAIVVQTLPSPPIAG